MNASPLRWRDPSRMRWTAMLTSDALGLHFSVQANGRRPTDSEVQEAMHAHEDARWVPREPGTMLMEITTIRDEMGLTANPWVRQFVSPEKHAILARDLERHRDRLR